MRKLVVALALTTTAVAIFFLLQRRAVVENPAKPQASATRSTDTAVPEAPSPSEPGTTVDSKEPQARDEEAEALRARLEDPSTREKILERLRNRYATEPPGGFERYVGLSPAEYARLMNLLADQELELLEASYQCHIKPECDSMSVILILIPEQRRALETMLGEARTQRVETFGDNRPDRITVAHFRDLLPEGQALSDEQSDRLIEALGEERRLAIREIEQRGSMSATHASPDSSIVIPMTAEGVDQKYEAARAYQQRLSSRASRVLDRQQLSLFDQIQADWLASMRRRWEQEAAVPRKP